MTHSGNFYLTKEQMTDNAWYIWLYLQPLGWTVNSVSAMLGNMQTESTINPGIWQNLDEGNLNLGFGIVQWTKASKYLDWCLAEELIPEEMDSNLLRILFEVENSLQWIKTSAYPLSFKEFRSSTLDPYTLGMMFLNNYERPSNRNQPSRGKQSQEWYTVLSGEEPNNPIPPNPSKVYKKLPLYYYMKRQY